MKTFIKPILFLAPLILPLSAEPNAEPIKALLITGGCCHDYAVQKDLLTDGLQKRTNIVIDQVHTDDSTTKPDLPIYGMENYADGYDVVIHNTCSADVRDKEIISKLLIPHKKGLPAVHIHCSIHSYRPENFQEPITTLGNPENAWFEFIGLQSTGHGPKIPLIVKYTDPDHPIAETLEGWTTGNEELYNNITVLETAHPIATGSQEGEKDAVVVWTNDYHGTRVFATSLGHADETVADGRFLDLVTRGLLWACQKLDTEDPTKP